MLASDQGPHRRWSAGIIGLGWVAAHVHIPALLSSDRIGPVTGFDVDPDRARQVASEFGLNLASSVGSLLGSDAELILIATPPTEHHSQAIAAIRAGKHVIIEKPLALSSEHARAIVSIARRVNRSVFCCNTNRYRRDVCRLKGLIDAGELGVARFVRATWLRNDGVPGTAGALQTGVRWDLGHHMVDLALWLTGWKAPAHVHLNEFSVAPAAGRRSAPWYGGSEMPPAVVFDTATIDAGFHEGGLHVEVSWSSMMPVDRSEVIILGSKRSASLSTVFGWSPDREKAEGLALQVSDPRARTWEPIVRDHDPSRSEYVSQLDHFLDILDDGGDWAADLAPTVETVGILTSGGSGDH